MSVRIVGLTFAAAIALAPPAARAQQSPGSALVVTPVTGDLSQFQVGTSVSVFLVTADGIVLVDPLGRSTVESLKKEFEERFPDRPVRYVVHASARFDRAEGASYLDDLDAGVVAGYEAGRSLVQLQSDAFLDAHVNVAAYAGRQQQIAAVYANVRAARLFVDVSPVVRRLTANDVYCDGFAQCGRDLLVPGGKVELSVSYRRLAVAAETSLEALTLASRTGPLYGDAWQQRVATGSLLVGRIAPSARRWAYSLLGGMSLVRSDAAGISRVKQAFFPAGSIRPRHERVTKWGITGGADIALLTGGRMAITVPGRITYAFGEPSEASPGPLSITGGIGFRWRVYRSAD